MDEQVIQHDDRGKFAEGNTLGPGRPPGCKNKTSVDLREIKRELAASWYRVGGAAIFDKMAETDPIQWAKLIVKVLPSEIDACIEQLGPKLDARELKPDDVRNYFHRQLIAIANGDPITSETVLRQLEINRAQRNGHSRSKQLPPPGDDSGSV